MEIVVLWILLGLIALIVVLLHFSVSVYIKGGTDGKFVIKVRYFGFQIYPRPPKEKRKPKKKRRKKKARKNVKEKDTFTFDDAGDFADDLEQELNVPQTQVDDIIESIEQINTEKSDNADEIKVPVNEEKADIKKELTETIPQAAINNEKDDVKETQKSAVTKSSDLKDKKEKKEKKKIKKAEKSKKEKSGGKLDEIKAKYKLIKPYIPLGWKSVKKLLKTIRFTSVRINVVTGKEDAYESAMFYGKIQAALFNILAVISGIFTVKIKEANVNCVFNEKKFKAQGETFIRVRPSTLIHIAVCTGVNFLIIFMSERKKTKNKRKKKSLNKNSDNSEKISDSGKAA